MSIKHTISTPISPTGITSEAVAMSLCDTRSALEALLIAVNAMVKLNEDMVERLENIDQSITVGTDKADQGIEAAKETRQAIQDAVEALKGRAEKGE